MVYGVDVSYKIVVFGDAGVGKTTLLDLKSNQLLENEGAKSTGVQWHFI